MPRRKRIRTWDDVEQALKERGVRKVQVARYYGTSKQNLNDAMHGARVLVSPVSEKWWQAIDDIKRGVLRDPEAE